MVKSTSFGILIKTMFRKLQQVTKYGFLFLCIFSCVQACPAIMEDGWTQLSVTERARKADVVAVGKAVEVHDDYSLVGRLLKVGGFHLFDILKGNDITEKIYASNNNSIFYILGFGDAVQCLTPIEEGKRYLLFAIFEPRTLSLIIGYDTPFAGTADPTIENQNEILTSLGWREWSDWSSCSAPCSGGTQSRTRSCVTEDCEGRTSNGRYCNSFDCRGFKNILKYFSEVIQRNTRSIPAPPTHRKAFKITNLKNISIPTHKIFSNTFPKHFTMFAAAKYDNFTEGYLVTFYDSHGRLQIGIKVSKTSIALEYAQLGKANQILAFNVEVIDRRWHQFAFSVGNGFVSFYLDCEMIGTQNITQEATDHVDRKGKIYLNSGTQQPQGKDTNIEFYIEELSLSDDVQAGQQQCAFKDLFVSSNEGPGSGQEELDYTWSPWTPCSKTCGTEGVRRRVKMCSRTSWSTSRDKCQMILQQSEQEPCNVIPCSANCHKRCVNGVCIARNKCKCKRNYYGPNCENKKASSCKGRCLNGGRCLTYTGVCKCVKGFTGRYCDKATCYPACQHGGVCTKSGVCKCRPGYLPPDCKPSCRPTCKNNGICMMPNRCYCKKGFSGFRCQYAVCKKLCLNGGVCYDNNKCDCKSGWTGDNCNIAICRPKCSNGGRCRSPNRCSCPKKTSGRYCQNVVCSPGCLNGGRCLLHNICLCSHRYSGSRCETPVCRPKCKNGGRCVAPNQCVCPSGYFGNSCERRSCIYKTRVVPHKRTEHIPITTSFPKWCSHHMGWRRCTEEKTEYRTVHITTYRTIYYCD